MAYNVKPSSPYSQWSLAPFEADLDPSRMAHTIHPPLITLPGGTIIEEVVKREVANLEFYEFREMVEGELLDRMPIRTVVHQGDYWLDITTLWNKTRGTYRAPDLLLAIKALFDGAERQKHGEYVDGRVLLRPSERRRRR